MSEATIEEGRKLLQEVQTRPRYSSLGEEGKCSPKSAASRPKTPHHHMLGLFLVACSAFTFSIMSTLIKYLTRFMPSEETVFWRAAVAWLMNLVAVFISQTDLHVDKKSRPALLTRCLVGFVGMSLGFWSISQMILADATVLMFTSPIFTFFLGAIFLRESIDLINFVCAVTSFVGVIFVARPSFIFGIDYEDASYKGTPLAVIAALLMAVAQSISYICMRKLGSMNFLSIIHYFLLTTSIGSFFSIFLSTQKFVVSFEWYNWLAIIGTGLFGFLGQLFLTKGFQLEKAGIASVMRYLDIVFVFVFDSTLLGEKISMWSIAGATIICLMAIVIALRKAYKN